MPQELVEVHAEEYDEKAGCEPLLLFWYAQEGEAVVEGQDLCEIETAKAVLVVTSPASGTLAEVCLPESSPVASGQLLARIAVA